MLKATTTADVTGALPKMFRAYTDEILKALSAYHESIDLQFDELEERLACTEAVLRNQMTRLELG